MVVSIILLVCLVLFYKLRITIEDETLCASFGTGIIRKRVRLAEIVGCEPIRIRWWYGWGIHLTPYGWLYNVSGLDAVAITLRDGRKFALGTDDPHGLHRGNPSARISRAANASSRSRTFLGCAAVTTLWKSCFGATPKPCQRCATLLQLAEPA